DLFLPSLDEIQIMLGYQEESLSPELLNRISNQLLRLGAQIVVLKLGEAGLYLRTGCLSESLRTRLSRHLNSSPDCWDHRELLVPCFKVNVAGTTGAGDSTIAGFLAAFSAGHSPEDCLLTAVGVGACSVEQPDATQGVISLEGVRERINSDWKQHTLCSSFSNWQATGTPSVFLGKQDASRLK
ncbi:MAG: hypothetical protein KDA78_07990, partial [Planctomycetaceae bacterium]|nr:hypothetical protein [Planctomycetaceae bacterium]